MGGRFACPECGQGLQLGGLTPGRAIQCDACETWVEVPFLPRVDAWKRGRPGRGRSKPWWESKLLRAAVGFAALALLGLAAGRMVGGRARSDRERVLADLIAAGDRAALEGKLGPALVEAEAALAQARTIDRPGSERLLELDRRRGEASVKEARARLGAVDALDPDRALGESLTLLARSEKDPALAPLAPSIEAKAAEMRLRRAEADLAAARRGFAEGRAAGAFDAAERLDRRAAELPGPDARRLQAEARAAIEDLVARSGIVVAPASGQFLIGSAEGYDTALSRPIADICKLRGYLLPPRPDSPWRPLWDERAPFRLTLRVVETRDIPYLQSRNRTTQVEGRYEFAHEGAIAWQAQVFARTRQPLLDLPAYQAGHLATSDRRDPAVERRFHRDALEQFVEQSARTLKGVPACAGAPRGP